MARVLFTAVVADMRNKLNGTVFSKNKSGAYTRTKVTPVNPQSASQTQNRQRLSRFSQLWRTLSLTAITAWNDLAKSQPFGTDVFGNPKFLSGLSLFVKLNSNIDIAMANQILDAPVLTTPPAASITAVNVQSDGTTLIAASFDYTLASTPVDVALVIYATRPYPVSQTFNTNLYRLVQVVPATAGGNMSFLPGYLATFGVPQPGMQVGVFIETIDKNSGMRIKGAEMIALVETV